MSVKFIVAAALSLICSSAVAQEDGWPSLRDFYVETRLAHETEVIDGDIMKPNTGFKGQWFNLRLDGNISEKISYSWRQRLNKPTAGTFLDATDWVHIDWQARENLSLSAGKQVVAIGGFEYDRAPIDLYYCSEFWNNIPCYQIGASGTLAVSDADNLTLQVCNTPFRTWNAQSKLGFNMLWSGSHGFWQTLWSVNLLQAESSSMNYIALGNRFNISDAIHLDIDIMNRAASDDISFFDDWSVMSELAVKTGDSANVFAKFTHDANDAVDKDLLVRPGTDISMVSLGAEFYPLKQNRHLLKLFVLGGYRFGENSNPSGTALDKQLLIQAGIKWRMDILKAGRR